MKSGSFKNRSSNALLIQKFLFKKNQKRFPPITIATQIETYEKMTKHKKKYVIIKSDLWDVFPGVPKTHVAPPIDVFLIVLIDKQSKLIGL